MLVCLDFSPQCVQFSLLLRTQRSGAFLFAFLFVFFLCASRTLLLLQLIHTSHPLHNLRIFVLLTSTHAFSLQLCLALNNVLLQLFQLTPLCGADASTLLFLWAPLWVLAWLVPQSQRSHSWAQVLSPPCKHRCIAFQPSDLTLPCFWLCALFCFLCR